jgi:L-lactate dehydrogenase complex protein LldE
MQQQTPTVGLFVTCLVDAWRPAVGFAAVRLLESAGCRVQVPEVQTCCGQPAYNSGDSADARTVAKGVIRAFADFDYVVVPSGSCAGTITLHYPELFKDDEEWHDRALKLAARTFELTSFLVDVLAVRLPATTFPASVAYHDSCSSLRELGVARQPRRLLADVTGLRLSSLSEAESCCGFGGLFCVKYPEISEKMVQAKVEAIVASGADTVLGGDLGCLLNIAGRLSRNGHSIHVRHVAEVLAGMTEDAPPIGETR